MPVGARALGGGERDGGLLGRRRAGAESASWQRSGRDGRRERIGLGVARRGVVAHDRIEQVHVVAHLEVLAHEGRVGHPQRPRREVVTLEQVGEARQLDHLGLPKAAVARKGAQKVHGHLEPPGGMHDVHEIQIVLETSVEELVHLAQPRERRLVLGRERGVNVHDDVRRLYVPIERAHDVHEHALPVDRARGQVAGPEEKDRAAASVHARAVKELHGVDVGEVRQARTLEK